MNSLTCSLWWDKVCNVLVKFLYNLGHGLVVTFLYYKGSKCVMCWLNSSTTWANTQVLDFKSYASLDNDQYCEGIS